MRSKQYVIDEQSREIMALRRYVADLKARHDMAISELAELAQGVGSRPSWGGGHPDWMKYKAACALREVAKMALREAP